MPTIGTKHMLKVNRLTEGKKIFLDLSVFLHGILDMASVELDNSSKYSKNLSKNLNRFIEGVEKVSTLLDEAITFDRDPTLVHDLMQSSTADYYKKRFVEERLHTEKSLRKRKSCSKDRLRAILATFKLPMKKSLILPKN